VRGPHTGGLRRKSFEIFRGLYDFGAGALRSSFYPVAIGGIAAPPVNIVRSSSGHDITPSNSLELGAVWSCVWLIADTIATLPFILNEREGSNPYGVPALDNPVYTVIGQQPNIYMTAAEFWQFMVASHLLWGSAYALKSFNGNGDVIALDTLLPQFMVPYKMQETGEIRYKYCPGGLMNDPQMDYSADEIYHLKDRTLDGMTGLSRIQYARNSLGIGRAAEQATGDTFRNGMKTNGLLMYDRLMKPEQRKIVKESLQKYRTGAEDSGGFMVLEAGMTFEALTMNPQDVQLLASRQFSVEDICRWFGVPPVLVGHAAQGVTSWGTGIEQLLMGFRSLTLRPYIRKIEQSVQRSLLKPKDRASTYLTIDTDDLLGADSAGRAALYSTYSQNGIMTRNEIRAKEDMAPKPGGDDLTVQSNLVPIEKLGQLGGQQGKPESIPTPGAAAA
jgi:HK97 family phage portal protein